MKLLIKGNTTKKEKGANKKLIVALSKHRMSGGHVSEHLIHSTFSYFEFKINLIHLIR